ncbi:hypothetical protein PV328_008942 [Microctonus aethiopoides]|uniref:Thioredoxin domain-containing protein n=1 Tax=Microctonus aethiopoides TaxID=144406 RepID=A0AA39KRL6_9HYME|nr:hypothetical protein PV328_008942 [Microctonus aethiopoides]
MSSQVNAESKNSKKGVVELTDSSNVDGILMKNELVIIFFYLTGDSYEAYNEKLDGTIDTVKKVYPRLKNVVIGKVNCNTEKNLLSRYIGNNSRPALLIYRNGQEVTRISTFPMDKYIFVELNDPIKPFSNIEELDNFDRTKHLIIGYFDEEDMPEYDIFRQVAHNLKDYCQFAVRYGYFFNNEKSNYKRPPNQPTIIFTPDTATQLSDHRETYKGCIKNYDELNLWAHKKCMVRELTLENYAELRKDRRSDLVVLFYNPSNTAIIKDFKNIIGKDLMDQKRRANFTTADGLKFFGYLRLLGFNRKHLPLIESEGYTFPNFKDIYSVGKFKAFVVGPDYGIWHKESLKEYMKSNMKKIISKC